MIEFNLSEIMDKHITWAIEHGQTNPNHADELIEDVKEFIRILKEDINQTLEEGITRNEILPKDWVMDRINDVIDKLAGSNLTVGDKLI
jgi:hypothetical protein